MMSQSSQLTHDLHVLIRQVRPTDAHFPDGGRPYLTARQPLTYHLMLPRELIDVGADLDGMVSQALWRRIGCSKEVSDPAEKPASLAFDLTDLHEDRSDVAVGVVFDEWVVEW